MKLTKFEQKTTKYSQNVSIKRKQSKMDMDSRGQWLEYREVNRNIRQMHLCEEIN